MDNNRRKPLHYQQYNIERWVEDILSKIRDLKYIASERVGKSLILEFQYCRSTHKVLASAPRAEKESPLHSIPV